MFALSDNSKKHRNGVDFRLVRISDLAIKLTLVDFGHGRDAGLRGTIRQQELYASGASNADGLTDISKHQTGDALDFYAYVDGKASWEPAHLAMVAAAFLQAASILGYKVQWGGLWKSKASDIYGWDMPHIQLVEG